MIYGCNEACTENINNFPLNIYSITIDELYWTKVPYFNKISREFHKKFSRFPMEITFSDRTKCFFHQNCRTTNRFSAWYAIYDAIANVIDISKQWKSRVDFNGKLIQSLWCIYLNVSFINVWWFLDLWTNTGGFFLFILLIAWSTITHLTL